MKDNKSLKLFLKDCKDFFTLHPTFVLTILYIYFTLLGIVYSIVYFNEFGIRIINFWRTTDYIFVLFETPIVVFILLFIILILVMFFFRTEKFVKSVLMENSKTDFKKLIDSPYEDIISNGLIRNSKVLVVLHFRRILFFPILFFTLLIPFILAYFSALNHANKVKLESGNEVIVMTSSNSIIEENNQNKSQFNFLSSLNRPDLYRIALIGLTEDFSFFYNYELGSTHIITNSSIIQIVKEFNNEIGSKDSTLVHIDSTIIDSLN